jgi:hypothetical protein
MSLRRSELRSASSREQQLATTSTLSDWVRKLQQVPKVGSLKSDGTHYSIQEYYETVSKNSIIINKAKKDNHDIQEYAQRIMRQPEPIIGVAPQPELNDEEDSLSTFNNIVRHINLIINNIYSRFVTYRTQQQTRQLTFEEKTANAKAILEQNINQLYNVNSELLHFLNVEQLLYLSKNNIIENTYYRKLELNYTLPFVDKFNEILNNILENMSLGVNINGYRYDLEYYSTIQKYFIAIIGKKPNHNTHSLLINNSIGELNLLRNKNKTNANIIRNIERDISNEKVLLINYIRHLSSLLENPPEFLNATLKNNIILFIKKLDNRFKSLGKIRLDNLKNIFKKKVYQIKRKNLVSILEALSILCKTFMLAIIVIRFTINETNAESREHMQIIQSTLHESIENYRYIVQYDINIRNMETNEEKKNIISDMEYDFFVLFEIMRNYTSENPNINFDEFYNINANILDESNRQRIIHELNYSTTFVELERRRERRRERNDSSFIEINRRKKPPTEFIIQSNMIKNVDVHEFDNKLLSSDINDMFKTDDKSIIQRLKTKYNNYNKDFNNNDKTDFYLHFRNKYKLHFNKDEPIQIISTNIINFVGHSIPSLFARYIKNNKDMKFNDLSKYFIINFSINNDSGNISSDRLSGIDIGGLRRDFITSLTTELFDSTNGIFMTREGTKKYFLNPNFKYDEYYEYIINKITNNQYDYKRFTNDFYEFIGKLITFILVNDCGLDKNISSYLAASLSKTINANEEPNFDDADYLYFMFEDFPEYTSSILNLMKMNPNDIEHTYIGFNDYYNLLDVDEDVTKDTISKFLYKTAKYMMTKTILRKGIDNISDSDYLEVVKNGEKINKLFIKGIKGDINNYLVQQKIPLKVVNSYLVNPTMSSEIIDKLISNFTNTMTRKIAQSSNQDELRKMTNLFIEYVLNNKKQLDEQEYHNFMDKLLKFWSGSSFYKEDENYKIDINNMLSDQHLPQSHTCFFLIDLPQYTGTNNDEIGEKLYNKIDIAIANVEEGIGLQGGGKLKKTKK